MKITFNRLEDTLKNILVKYGCSKTDSSLIAKILTENSCDGVSSHGVNRFTKIIDYIKQGYINIKTEPEIVSSLGALEVVDGNYGLGIKNAYFSMDRAIALAKKHGISCVALRKNNHWMRGATYGLQASKEGMIGICFTNTLPNMPAWGSVEATIGNNPLVISIPNKNEPIVLDMAMSQFSYGRIETSLLNKTELPMEGGFNTEGDLTKNPSEILESGRILPTGFWKGSGLSMVLDLMATILSGGFSTREIGNKPVETGVSQIFICIDPSKNSSSENISTTVESMIKYIKSSKKDDGVSNIKYPGEGSRLTREKQETEGIYVDDNIWKEILKL